jgi:hypothetical protein
MDDGCSYTPNPAGGVPAQELAEPSSYHPHKSSTAIAESTDDRATMLPL